MKREILSTTVGALVALLSLLGVPAYAGGMVDTEAAADTAASAEGDMLVSAVVPILAEVIAATVELGSADQLARMRQGLIHPESQPVGYWRLRAKVLRTANLDWNADLWLKCEATK